VEVVTVPTDRELFLEHSKQRDAAKKQNYLDAKAQNEADEAAQLNPMAEDRGFPLFGRGKISLEDLANSGNDQLARFALSALAAEQNRGGLAGGGNFGGGNFGGGNPFANNPFYQFTAGGFGNSFQNALAQQNSLLQGNANRQNILNQGYQRYVAPAQIQGQTQLGLGQMNLQGRLGESANLRHSAEFAAEAQRRAAFEQAQRQAQAQQYVSDQERLARLGVAGEQRRQATDVANIGKEQALGTANIGRQQATDVANIGREQALGTAELQRQQATQVAYLNRIMNQFIAEQQRGQATDVARLGLQQALGTANIGRQQATDVANIGREQALGTADLERQFREFTAAEQARAQIAQAQLEALYRQQVAELQRQQAVGVEQERTNRSLSVLPSILQSFTGAVAGSPGGFNFGSGGVGVQLSPNAIGQYLPQ